MEARGGEVRTLGHTTVLEGERGGKYPHGNSLLVVGTAETVVVDPSLSLVGRAERPRVDRVLNSHCHEDHVAGNHLFPEVPWHLPDADLPGIRSHRGDDGDLRHDAGDRRGLPPGGRRPVPLHAAGRCGGIRRRRPLRPRRRPAPRDPRPGSHARALALPRRARRRALPRRHRPLELRAVLRGRVVVARGLRADARARARDGRALVRDLPPHRGGRRAARRSSSASIASPRSSPPARRACSPTSPSRGRSTRSSPTASSTARATRSPSPTTSSAGACASTSTVCSRPGACAKWTRGASSRARRAARAPGARRARARRRPRAR